MIGECVFGIVKLLAGKYNASEKLCISKTSYIQRNQSTPAIWFVDEIGDTKKKTEFEEKKIIERNQTRELRKQRAQARNAHRNTEWNQKKKKFNESNVAFAIWYTIVWCVEFCFP